MPGQPTPHADAASLVGRDDDRYQGHCVSNRDSAPAPGLLPPPGRLALAVERHRIEHRAPALRGAAAADVERELLRVVVALPGELIVVTQLLAGPDIADRIDEHAAILDDGLAVCVAGVVNVARLVAAHARVDADAVVDDEQECVTIVLALLLVARVRLLVRDAIAEIFDDARSDRYFARRIYTAAVDPRPPDLVGQVVTDRRAAAGCRAHVRMVMRGSLGFLHTAIGALMAGCAS